MRLCDAGRIPLNEGMASVESDGGFRRLVDVNPAVEDAEDEDMGVIIATGGECCATPGFWFEGSPIPFLISPVGSVEAVAAAVVADAAAAVAELSCSIAASKYGESFCVNICSGTRATHTHT